MALYSQYLSIAYARSVKKSVCRVVKATGLPSEYIDCTGDQYPDDCE
jgi:protoheme ferro-lyase